MLLGHPMAHLSYVCNEAVAVARSRAGGAVGMPQTAAG